MKNGEGHVREKKQLRKGDRVPRGSLKTCSEVGVSVLNASRGPRVFVAVHALGCKTCIEYVKQVVHMQDELSSWGGHVTVVCPECSGDSAAALAPLGVPVLEDRISLLAVGRLTVIIADEWDEIYFASESEDVHGVISPDEVLEWVKFVAIQCPECEGPEGEWRNL
jgi:hypothetical protein